MNKYYSIFFLAVVFAAFGQVLLKKGAILGITSFWKQFLSYYVLFGYCLLFLSLMMVSFSYREVPLKMGPVFDSFGFIFVPLFSWLFFGEKFSTIKIFGFALIILGVIVF